jgi:anti-sigma regulatory factor (Ser/Thr protein kinase)
MVEPKELTNAMPGALGRERAREIREYILAQLSAQEFRDVSQSAMQRFGTSRQVIHKQLKRLEAKQLIEGRGKTNAKVHRLAVTRSSRRVVVDGLNEDTLWREFVQPSLRDLPENVYGICQYGFTEMVNNVIDHSESKNAIVSVERTAASVELIVTDVGVGIFRKIQNAMTLPSLQEALFELTKGKFTTDPTRHTGEGIFYTSRTFDVFRLLSNGLFLHHLREGDDWLLGSDDRNDNGTFVAMKIAAKSEQTMQEVFEYYAAERDDYGFSKTNVVLRLLDTGDDSFVSRSQAKRALARLPRFKEVLLDFDGVQSIGPAFADEIFRVFAAEHPEVHLTAIRANEDVRKMVDRALRAGNESPLPSENTE